jgi:hypothetical protein
MRAGDGALHGSPNEVATRGEWGHGHVEACASARIPRDVALGDKTLWRLLARTLAALRALQRRLAGTGQALQRIPTHRYALVPDATR